MLQIIAAGRLGKDAVTRNAQNGDSYTGFSIAVDQGKDKQARWVECTIKGDRGVKLQPHLKKGTAVCVTGLPDVSIFTPDNGQAKAQQKCWVDRLTFLSKAEGAGNQGDNGGQGGGGSGGGWDPPADLDDEIPFARMDDSADYLLGKTFRF